MALTRTDHKVGILLSPQRLLTNHVILEIFHSSKSKGLPAYEVNEIDHSELATWFPQLPVQAKSRLLHFNKAAVQNMIADTKSRFQLKKAGINFQSYYNGALLRRLHEELQFLKPFAGLVKWYHKREIEKGKFVTAPCQFSDFKPQLSFEVQKEGDQLQIQTQVNLNGSPFPLTTFNRYHFLLESRNEYFLLSFKDYQTLHLLEEQDATASDVVKMDFRELLSKLEADYPVNRNNFLPTTEIAVSPTARVLLSEISNAFLVFTPQFNYDGFVVEGAWKEAYETVRNGDTFIIRRNREAELAFLQKLESLYDKFPKQLNGYYYLSFAEAQKKQWFLKVYHRLLEDNVELAGMDMLHHFRYSSHKIQTDSTMLSKDEYTVTLAVKVYFGDDVITNTELQKIVRAGQKTVMLKDGSFGVLHEQWLKHYGLIFTHGKVNGNKMEVARWLAFSEESNDEFSDVLKPALDKNWFRKWQLWQLENESIYAVPSSIKAALRPYQKKGFEWMVLLSEAGAGACLADDMGLGKTLQTICFLAYHLEREPAKRHLIVCPSSLIYNWQEELQKFAPHISTSVYHGAGRKSMDMTEGNCQVLITSYGTVRADIETLSVPSFGVVILDESHTIKNPDAQVTKAVSALQSAIRVALSGTPLINNTIDLFAQINFIVPGMLGGREFFKREYANPIDRDADPDKVIALKKLTAPFMLRRTKAQVAPDLPERTESIMWCNMKASQKAAYEDLKSTIRDSVFLNIKNEGLNKSKLAVIQGMMKLRQLCNSPMLIKDMDNPCVDSVKMDVLMYELMNNLQGHKVLIFSQFTRMLDLLAESCDKHKIAYFHFDGQTPPAKRAEMVSRFQEEDNNTNVFLISLKAGNTGLNLTAADYVFLIDPWWNTAIEQQAIDRTHRIGQLKKVFAYKMICKDTIEERIIQIQERKRQLSQDLVSEEDSFVKSLTEQEIQFLFS